MRLQDGLIAFWAMDENGGDTLASLVNACQAATLAGTTPPIWTTMFIAGSPRSALTFNGVSSYVDLTSNVCYKPLTGFSVSCWFARSVSANGVKQFLLCGRAAAPSGAYAYDWSLLLDTDNKLTIDPFNVAVIKSPSAVTNGNVHHVVFTWSGPVTHVTKIYLDNVLVLIDSTTWTSWYGYSATGGFTNDSSYNTPAVMGKNTWAVTNWYKGKLGPTGVWNRELTADEVASLYATPVPVIDNTPAVRPDYGFHPVMTDGPAELNARWAASPLAEMIGPRTWEHVLTVNSGGGADYETIAEAVAAANAAGTSSTDRYAVLIADGSYDEQVSLWTSGACWIDLIGQSKGGVRWDYSVDDSNYPLVTSRANTLVAHLSLTHTGNPSLYSIHNDGLALDGDYSRTAIFLDLDFPSMSTSRVHQSIGSGYRATGDQFWYLGLDCESTLYNHANQGANAAPNHTYILDCNTGCYTAPGHAPLEGINWQTYNSGQPDAVVVRGGTHRGTNYGLNVNNGGTPPEALSVVLTDGATLVGGKQNVMAQGRSFTDLANSGGVVTSATYSFGSYDKFQALVITGGAGWTLGTYTIDSVAAGAATLHTNPGGSTGGVGYLVSNRVFDTLGRPYPAANRVLRGIDRGDGTPGTLAATQGLLRLGR